MTAPPGVLSFGLVGLVAFRLVIGMVACMAGLLTSLLCVGPLVRRFLGDPIGWHQDFTSKEAILQAALSQLLSLAIVYFVTGAILSVIDVIGNGPELHPNQIVNALSVALGYTTFRAMVGDTSEESYGLLNGLLLVGIAPFLFPFLLKAGILNRSARRTEQSNSIRPNFLPTSLRVLYYALCLTLVLAVYLKLRTAP